jgi:hypothetical protein
MAIGVWVEPGPSMPPSDPAMNADDGVAVLVGQERHRLGLDVLVAGIGHLELRGQVHPELDAVEQAARVDQRVRWALDVQDARAGGHPLRRAILNHAAATDGVLVQEGAVDHVGDGLEAAVRVPRCALGLAGPVVDLAHLVHVHERVEVGHVDAGEGPTNREPLAFETARRGGDGRDAAWSIGRLGLDGLG